MWNAEESEERLADILLTLWGSGKIESEVSCPDVGTASGMYPKSVMSNGIAQAGNVALAEATLSNKKSGFPQNACTSRTEEDKSDLFDVKGTSSEHVNKKTIGQKSNSALQLANTNDNSQIVDEKGDVYLPNKKKEHDKGPDTPSKEMAPTTQKEHKKGVEPHVSEKLKKDKTVVSPSSNEKFPDTSHPKRGKRHRPRVIKMKKGGAGDAHVSSSSSHKAKAIVGTDTEVLLSSTKQKEGSKDSDRIPGRHSGTKQSAGRVGDSGKSSSHRKLKVDAGSDEQGILLRKLKKLHLKVREGDTSGRRQCSKSKLQKSRYSFDNEMVSSRKTTAKGMEESKSWKKRSRAKISETTGHTLKYDESLVGAKIKVWWQVDKTFYPCTVDSYDPVSKRHKVLYFDGDVEVLLLKNECFKFIGDGEREEEGNLSPEATSEPSKKRKESSEGHLHQSFLKKRWWTSRKPGRHRWTKQSAGGVEDSAKSSSHRKMEVDVGSGEDGRMLHMAVCKGDTSGRHQHSKSKPQMCKNSSDTEMVSSPKMAAKGDKDQVILEESKLWKKSSGAEISETTGHTLKYDESLVGAKIKVWWQVDKTRKKRAIYLLTLLQRLNLKKCGTPHSTATTTAVLMATRGRARRQPGYSSQR